MTATQLFAVPDAATTVLLDIGGVLYVDPWETLLLTPRRGIADRLGLDRDQVEAVGLQLWPRFATAPSTEGEYWAAISRGCGARVEPDLVADVSDELLGPTPDAAAVLDLVGGRRLGVVTDNTSFWYERQVEELGLSDRIDPALEFASFRLGVRKRSDPGLFSLASARCEPARTLVVDDRRANLELAAALGFLTREHPHAGSR